ncbi:alpha-(1,3)-fucosyltransferase 10 [Macrosteles quadrilineatus]|uniref:alpha-(1,3)-fucosyltransferase 10 n=1 Tax=Macrosteles quadrilineatus TaxID=74068 RepID=UPI0023E1E36F|nr:alpha-(1,3)-fucosyltransferase 10 [Macrosteles quadrilineatus]XP_054258477.1 alpha-(1,3)-fucosyltransferase 10 [Macrosteles quadrilineatus]
MRVSLLCKLVAAATVVLVISQIALEVFLNDEESWLFPSLELNTSEDIIQLYEEVAVPVVVWWAPLGGIQHSGRWSQCGQLSCFFTNVPRFRNHPNLKGFLFYGTSINWTDLPLPRAGPSVFWALLHEESPRNNIPLSHASVISLFNYTSTFSRYSDVPTTTQFLSSIKSLTDMKHFETVEAKNGYQKNQSWQLAPVVYIQTDCSTPLDRDSYVAELSKYIRVDSYGRCLHNRNLPPHLQSPFTLRTMMSDDLLDIVGKYKFAVAFENGVCDDYITEKLWRPLISGAVPIYIGSPTVSDWLPNNRSAILALDFESPKHLAEYLVYLNSHDDEYNSYLSHKLQASLTNSRLIQDLNQRQDDSYEDNFLNKFECFICKKAHEKNPEISIASNKHYSCEMPKSIVTRQPNVTNYWLDWWFLGRCEAKTVRKFIDLGVANYTIEEYNNAVREMTFQNKCKYSEENAKELHLEQAESQG